VEQKASFPEKAQFLFRPYPYKVMRGGRGSSKSHSAAGALVIQTAQKPHRVLCTREVQTSIKDSVHKLLCDKIEDLNLGMYYTVLQNEIRARNGGEFMFSGLADQTATSIKSFEGISRCWCEEAQVISKRSWDILLPTIRYEDRPDTKIKLGDAEIWVTYNPELESDPTHQMFTVNPPPGTMNVEMNWRDNPWFPKILEARRQYCLKNDPDNYDNIWEGKCKPAVEGAIFFKQIQEAEVNRRICNIPHEPMLKVHVVLDLGWGDSLAASLVQKHLSEIRIIEYLEFNQTRLDILSNELKKRPYDWGRVWLPYADGFSKTLNSGGKSTCDILEKLGWDVVPKTEIVDLTVEQGIKITRMAFHKMYFDKSKCGALEPPKTIPGENEVKHTEYSHRLVECLKRYRRNVNKTTGAETAPVRNTAAHGGDCTRYIAINADNMDNEGSKTIIVPNVRKVRYNQTSEVNSGSWMAI